MPQIPKSLKPEDPPVELSKATPQPRPRSTPSPPAGGTRGAPKQATRSGRLKLPQIRILCVLAEAPGPLRKDIIGEEVAARYPSVPYAARFEAWMGDPIGLADPDKRPNAEAKAGYPSLLTLKYITTKQLNIEGKLERVYSITDEGLKWLREHPNERG